MGSKNLDLEQLSEGKTPNETGGNSPGEGKIYFTISNEGGMIKQPFILLKVTKKVMAPRFPGSCPTDQKRVMRSCGSFDT